MLLERVISSSSSSRTTTDATTAVTIPSIFECAICLQEQAIDFRHSLDVCRHTFCRDCMQHYFEEAISTKSLPIKCPMPDCRKEVTVADLEFILSPEMVKKYDDFSLHYELERNPDVYSCCPTPNCGYFFTFETGDAEFHCPKCNKHYCLRCKCDWHDKITCEKYQEWAKENGKADDLFEQFVQGQKLKRCPRCNSWVEKTSGCPHMTCRCGHKWCFSCGGSFPCKCGEDPHVPMAAWQRAQPNLQQQQQLIQQQIQQQIRQQIAAQLRPPPPPPPPPAPPAPLPTAPEIQQHHLLPVHKVIQNQANKQKIRQSSRQKNRIRR